MPKYVPLRTVVVDTQPLRPGSRQITFFGERTGVSPSVTAPSEREVARLLLAFPQFSALVLEELGLSPTTKYALNARSPFTSASEKPGDVDVLLVDPAQPHLAVALECKRVKVRTDTEGSQRINRLESLAGAYVQANALDKIGFSRTFLTALVVVDGRFEPENNFIFRGTSSGTFQELFDMGAALPLSPGLGLLYVELSQPVNAPVEVAATLSVGILKPADVRAQQGWLTTTVLNYMAEHGQVCGIDSTTAGGLIR